ncbi:hypothetical protein FOS14_22460 [Skermania sp. ID1734]|uniref:hypothetical protein n=1 Tax=Skermania sp. ID1734 TaxID=2597516 RepID=UPI00117E9E16|nr:hypothetical protein [Skermania sp. ID1734]TSD93624.1 hypothetical protein FOS14_22460 [Skermania sp. ID1734]
MLLSNVRRAATFALVLAAGVVSGSPAAFADSGSSSGSAVIDGGSSIAQGCVQDPGGCVGAVLNGGSSVLGTGSQILGTGSLLLLGLGGPGQNAPAQGCGASTKSGHDGVTTTVHNIGRTGPVSFNLTYDTEDVPDLIDVFYEDRQIASTGWVGNAINNGVGSLVVHVPPGSASVVVVRVTGGTSTNWEYTVNCP